MSTVDDIVTAALSRADDFGTAYPGARSVLYRRLSNRGHQLFALAANINSDFFNVSAVGTLASGDVSFFSMGESTAGNPTFAPLLVTRVEIADKGTSPYTNGDEVNIVSHNDGANAAKAPRATIRNDAIVQYGTDLALVTSLRMYYARRPFRLDPSDGGATVDFPETHEELLVIDLTKWIIRKADNPSVERRSAAQASLDEEEKELLVNFVQEVEQFTSAVETGRFARTTGPSRQ